MHLFDEDDCIIKKPEKNPKTPKPHLFNSHLYIKNKFKNKIDPLPINLYRSPKDTKIKYVYSKDIFSLYSFNNYDYTFLLYAPIKYVRMIKEYNLHLSIPPRNVRYINGYGSMKSVAEHINLQINVAISLFKIIVYSNLLKTLPGIKLKSIIEEKDRVVTTIPHYLQLKRHENYLMENPNAT